MSEDDLHRSVVPKRQPAVDQLVSRKLVNLANRTTRRSFLATVGRASTALLGAGFLTPLGSGIGSRRRVFGWYKPGVVAQAHMHVLGSDRIQQLP